MQLFHFLSYDVSCDNHVIPPQGNQSTPWFSILTSPPVWGIMVVYFCTNWGFYTLLTCIPTFIKQTLGCSNNIVSFQAHSIVNMCKRWQHVILGECISFVVSGSTQLMVRLCIMVAIHFAEVPTEDCIAWSI